MIELVVLILIILLLCGGGWGYRTRWSTGVFGGPDVFGIIVAIIVIVVVLRLVGLF